MNILASSSTVRWQLAINSTIPCLLAINVSERYLRQTRRACPDKSPLDDASKSSRAGFSNFPLPIKSPHVCWRHQCQNNPNHQVDWDNQVVSEIFCSLLLTKLCSSLLYSGNIFMHSILKEGRLARLVSNFDQDSNISELRMKADLFRHTLSQEMAFFDSRTVGDIQVIWKLAHKIVWLMCF